MIGVIGRSKTVLKCVSDRDGAENDKPNVLPDNDMRRVPEGPISHSDIRKADVLWNERESERSKISIESEDMPDVSLIGENTGRMIYGRNLLVTAEEMVLELEPVSNLVNAQ